MKVLFLDIDGVCNSLEYAQRNGMNLWHATDPELNKLVRALLMRPNARLCYQAHGGSTQRLRRLSAAMCATL